MGGGTLALSSTTLTQDTTWTVHRNGRLVYTLPPAPDASPAPRPVLERVTDRRLPTAVLYPAAHVTGRKLPVLLDLGAGPGHQQVTLARPGGTSGNGGRRPASPWSVSIPAVRPE